MRSPIQWFGGKGRMTAKLLPFIPSHHTYVEIFAGGASLLFAKKPSAVEVYNDLDEGLANFFRMLRDPDQFARFYHLACLTPYSRVEFNTCRETWEKEIDPVIKAYNWFVVARQSFSGVFGTGWSSSTASSRRGMAMSCSKWLSTLRMLPEIAERMLTIQIEQQDWRTILKRYDAPETFFYMDPPYIPSTRRKGKYAHEMSAEDHKDLVQRLLVLKGKALLSGYDDGSTYSPLVEAGWHCQSWEVDCWTAGGNTKKPKRIETVWWNYELSQQLLFGEEGSIIPVTFEADKEEK